MQGYTDFILKGDQLVAPKTYTLPNYANDAAAWAGGLAAGQFYRNGSAVCIVVLVPFTAAALLTGAPAIGQPALQ